MAKRRIFNRPKPPPAAPRAYRTFWIGFTEAAAVAPGHVKDVAYCGCGCGSPIAPRERRRRLSVHVFDGAVPRPVCADCMDTLCPSLAALVRYENGDERPALGVPDVLRHAQRQRDPAGYEMVALTTVDAPVEVVEVPPDEWDDLG